MTRDKKARRRDDEKPTRENKLKSFTAPPFPGTRGLVEDGEICAF